LPLSYTPAPSSIRSLCRQAERPINAALCGVQAIRVTRDVQTIDFSGKVPNVRERWSLLGDDTSTWRPGGWQVISQDDDGHVYALMHADGYDGSHKSSGTEVWVIDPGEKKIVRRIKLKTPGWSVGVSAGKTPMVVTASLEGFMDVYDAKTGEHLRQLESTVAYNPVAMFPAP
ncbi:MAG: amine dehydrogenase large subunit, partial [Pseudomonadota bacterium]